MQCARKGVRSLCPTPPQRIRPSLPSAGFLPTCLYRLTEVKDVFVAEASFTSVSWFPVRFAPRLRNEYVLHFRQLVSFQLASTDCHRLALLARLVVCEIDEMILCKLRVKSNVHQARLPADVIHLRKTGNGLGLQFTITNNTQAPFAFDNKRSAVGQKREAIGINQVLGNRDN